MNEQCTGWGGDDYENLPKHIDEKIRDTVYKTEGQTDPPPFQSHHRRKNSKKEQR